MRIFFTFLINLFVIQVCWGANKDLYIINTSSIQPLSPSNSKTLIVDTWISGNYNFSPFTELEITTPDFIDLEFNDKFYSIGVQTDFYTSNNSLVKYGLGIGYNWGSYSEKSKEAVKLRSSWIYVDLSIRLRYAGAGIICYFLTSSQSKNSYETGVFRFNECYYHIRPLFYIKYTFFELSRFIGEMYLGLGLPQLNPNRMYKIDPTNGHSTSGVLMAFKVSYKLLSTSKTNRSPRWF